MPKGRLKTLAMRLVQNRERRSSTYVPLSGKKRMVTTREGYRSMKKRMRRM